MSLLHEIKCRDKIHVAVSKVEGLTWLDDADESYIMLLLVL